MYLEGLKGTISAAIAKNIDDQLELDGDVAYDQYNYERSTVATTAELEAEPVHVPACGPPPPGPQRR